MKILAADFSFDEKKLTFYFCAEGRLDFRSLVYDLAKSFNKIIRLQQVGARDEAKIYGGFGKCGRELCCRKFLCIEVIRNLFDSRIRRQCTHSVYNYAHLFRHRHQVKC